VKICRARGAVAPGPTSCTPIATINNRTGTYTDYNVKPSTQYTYALFAFDTNGDFSSGSDLPTETPCRHTRIMRISGLISRDTTWTGACDVYLIEDTTTVEGGVRLEIESGAVVKYSGDAGLYIGPGGSLDVDGTAAHPVVFTSRADDSVAGDTNGDGPSTGAPDTYAQAIELGGGGSVTVTGAVFRYAGEAIFEGEFTDVGQECPAYGNDHLTVTRSQIDAPIWLGSCTRTGGVVDIEHNRFDVPLAADVVGAIDIDDPNGTSTTNHLTVAYNTFEGADAVHTSRGTIPPEVDITGWDISGFSLSGASTNTFTGTGPARAVELAEDLVAAGESWTVDRASGAVLEMQGGSPGDLQAGLNDDGIVALEHGSVVKVSGTGIEVAAGGLLEVEGTPAHPVVFTDRADDSVGGDTDGDGSSTGSGDEQAGNLVYFDAASRSDSLRYGLFENSGTAIDVQGGYSVLTVQNSEFVNNRDAFDVQSDPSDCNPPYTNDVTALNDWFGPSGAPGLSANALDIVGLKVPEKYADLFALTEAIVNHEANTISRPVVTRSRFPSGLVRSFPASLSRSSA